MRDGYLEIARAALEKTELESRVVEGGPQLDCLLERRTNLRNRRTRVFQNLSVLKVEIRVRNAEPGCCFTVTLPLPRS